MKSFKRKSRTSIEIMAYVHFNPIYRAFKRSIKKVRQLRAAFSA
jgi:hypothetical protein